MKQIIGRVIRIEGKFIAEQRDGEIRQLNLGDPVYEGDAIYHAPLEQYEPNSYISIQLNNGDIKNLTDSDYLMLDPTLLGQDILVLSNKKAVYEDSLTNINDEGEDVKGEDGGVRASYGELNDDPNDNGYQKYLKPPVISDNDNGGNKNPDDRPNPNLPSYDDNKPPFINDIPKANDDHIAVKEGSNGGSGNVILNDDFGADRPESNFVVGVRSLGNPSNSSPESNVGREIQGMYGKLTLNSDGSYTYVPDKNTPFDSLGDNEQIVEKFVYTIADKDGDKDNGVLTISINGQDDGTPVVTTAEGFVHEKGLSDGTDPTSGAQTTTGSFTFTAPDGFVEGSTIKVGNTSLTYSDVVALASSNKTIDTSHGTLTLNNFEAATNKISYSYTLNGNVDNSSSEPVKDSIAIEVKDGSGSGQAVGTGLLTINIADDAPVANADTNAVSKQDTLLIGANNPKAVLENDLLGADGAKVTQVSFGNESKSVTENNGAEIRGEYGTLYLHSDGSYNYFPDTAKDEVNLLSGGEKVTDVFSYVITDGDGNISSSTLSIDVTGLDNGVAELTVTNGSVSETGLSTGSNPSAPATFTDKFSFTAPDLFTNGSSVKINNTEFSYADIANLSMSPKTVDTTYGKITLTGFNSASNEITYVYTLTKAADHTSENTPEDEIEIEVQDGNGIGQYDGPGKAVIKIAIADDVPEAREDYATAGENSNATGNVLANDIFGADRIASGNYVTGVAKGAIPSGGHASGNVATEIAGTYGKLVINADGSYTYTPDNSDSRVNSLGDGESLTEVFSYTITDSDGDRSTASLTLTINGQDDGAPVITSAGGSVHEKGLSDGTDPASGAQTTAGSFTFTAPDGFLEGSRVNVGGRELTYAEVTALSSSNTVAINTPKGVLTLNGFEAATNKISYIYTLSGSVDNSGSEPATDSIAISVKDGSGVGQSAGTGNLVITINDDEPLAQNDYAAAGENSNATGNVLANDIFGADRIASGNYVTGVVNGALPSGGHASGNVATEIAGTYGKLVINADGSYTYTPDNSDSRVNSLGDGEHLTEVFSYTITDSDGDRSTASLTLTINGQDDGAPVITSAGGSVHEKGLSDGTDPASGAQTTAGSFTFTAPDGFLEGSRVEVGGRELTYAEVTSLSSSNAVAINTPKGVLTLNGFEAATNKLSYVYTLSGSVDNSGSEPATDIIAISVKDGSGVGQSAGTGNLVIAINDDEPLAQNDSATAGENSNATGNVLANDALGADRVASGEYVTGVVNGALPSGSHASGNVATEIAGTYGKLVINADGSYTYTPDNSDSRVNSLGNGEHLTEVFSYTITDSDGDRSTAALTLTINGQDDGAPVITSAGGSVHEKGLSDGTDPASGAQTTAGSFTFTAPDGFLEGSRVEVGGRVLTYAEVTSLSSSNAVVINTPKGVLTLNGFEAATNKLSYVYTLSGSVDNSGSEPATDIIAISVKDGSGVGQSAGTGNLVITINEDAPIAVDDVNSIRERQDITASSVLDVNATNGVLANDKFGADRIASGEYVTGVVKGALASGSHASGNVGTEISGAYGKLQINADGSYTYKLDNANPEVNALKNGDTKTDTFSYTISDSDGDQSTATLSITINGTNDTPVVNNLSFYGDKNAGYDGKPAIEINITAQDADTPVSHFKLTSLPDVKEGKLYTDAACTQEAAINTDIAVTSSNALKLYFKPNYGNESSLSDFGPSWTKTGSITFTALAKDSSNADSVDYSNPATITIGINDLPYANQAGEKAVTENNFGSTANSVSGNLITDGSSYSDGIDYLGNGPVVVHQIKFKNASGNTETKTLTDTSTTIVTDLGNLVVNRETGAYTFTPNASLNNPSGGDLEAKFQYSIAEKNTPADISNFAEQVIKIQDGNGPSIGSIATQTINEANLPSGTNPVPNDTSVTKPINLTAGSDPVKVEFAADQTALDSIISQGLTSKGRAVTYSIINNGTKLVAKAGGADLFEVTINNPEANGTGALTATSYTFKLSDALDHKTALLTGSDLINLKFGIVAADNDDPANDKAIGTIDIMVKDDYPQESTFNIDEDSDGSSPLQTSADSTFGNTHIGTGEGYVNDHPTHGTATVNSDGNISYIPQPNYSGKDEFKYTTVTDGGTVQTVKVTVNISPVADAPELENDKALTVNEDTAVALNLVKPVITDNIDQNGAEAGDHPERLGLIEIGGVSSGAVIKNGGTSIFTGTDSNHTMKVYITDDPNLHYSGLDHSGAIGLTAAEYQALTITGAADSHKNIPLTVKVTSYEVDDSGVPINGVAGASSTQSITVDVHAVTDPVSLGWSGLVQTGTGANDPQPIYPISEDNWMRIDNLLVPTLNDTDGSEKFKYVLDCTSFNGWKYKVGTNGQANLIGSGGQVKVDFNGSTPPELYLLPPSNSSADLKDLKVKLVALDEDSDSPLATPTETSAELTLKVIVVNPKAGDITATASGVGNEDSYIKLDFDLNKADPTEYVSGVKISNIPTGADLYLKTDEDSYTNLSNGTGTYTISGQTESDMTTLLGKLYVLPKTDDNTDFKLKLRLECTDTDDDDTSVKDIAWTSESDITVKVKGIVDTHDSTETGRLYTEIGNVQTLADAEPQLNVNEDGILDLGLSFESYENKLHGTNDKSELGEETYFIIRNQLGDNTPFTVCDSTGKILGVRTAEGGWKLTVEELSQAHFKPQADWAGDIKLEMLTHVTDVGDDKEEDWHPLEQVDKFKIHVEAVPDAIYGSSYRVFTTEDTPVFLDINPYTTDNDGSEGLVKVTVKDIPYGSVIKVLVSPGVYKDVFVSNDLSGDPADYTFTIDETTTDFHKSAFGNHTGGKLAKGDIGKLFIQTPAHSSGDFNITLEATIKEELNDTTNSGTFGVQISVKGKTDTPSIYVGNDSSGDFGTRVNTEEATVNSDGTVTWNSNATNVATFYGLERVDSSSQRVFLDFNTVSGELKELQMATDPDYKSAKLSSDKSEVISYVIKDLPAFVKPVDENGNPIGTLLKKTVDSNGNELVEWSLDADSVNDGVFFEIPVGWSGKIKNLTMISIVQEGDGDMTDRLVIPMPFELEVNPVITSNPIPGVVQAVEDAAPDANNAFGTLSLLPFVTNDPTNSETISKILIPINKVHEGLDLYVKEGENWVKVDGNANYIDGSNYKFTDPALFKDGLAVAVDPNGSLKNVHIEDESVKIGDVTVTVIDVENDGNTISKDITSDIVVKLSGIADKPIINDFSSSHVSNRIYDLNIDVDFPDNDGSETHLYTITISENSLAKRWGFDKGVNSGSGTWVFTKEEVASGIKAIAPVSSNAEDYKFELKAYAIEGKTSEVSSAIIDFEAVPNAFGGTSKYAQIPTLTLLRPESLEDNGISFDKIIDCDNTHTNDSDGGNEFLSFTIKDLPEGFTIESDKVMKFYDSVTGEPVYSFAAGIEPSAEALKTLLQGIKLVPPEGFSGTLPKFTVSAVVTETDGYDIAVLSKDATVDIKPVADAFVAALDQNTVNEDSKVPIKITFASSDTITSSDDKAETFENISIGVEASKGVFVKQDGTVLGNNLAGVSIHEGNQVKYLGHDVHFRPKEDFSGQCKISLTADAKDKTIVNGSEITDVKTFTQELSLNIEAVADKATISVDTVNLVGSNHGIYETQEDMPVNLNLSAVFTDNDGSELHSLIIKNVPTGAIFVDNSGKMVGSNNGDGTWSFLPEVLSSTNGFRFVPPLHKNGDIRLELYALSTEISNQDQAVVNESFTIRIKPIANGVTIPLQYSNPGSWTKAIAVGLKVGLVEQLDYQTSPLKDEEGNDFISKELYKVEFKSKDSAEFQLYVKDSAGNLSLLHDTNSAPDVYTVEKLTQSDLDNLYLGMESDLDGVRLFDLKIASQEVDEHGNVTDTSSYVTKTLVFTLNNTGESIINGTGHNEALYGHAGDQSINGGAGNDYIYGGEGEDTVHGDVGNDHIYGGTGNDELHGDAGDDFLYGGEGNDNVHGGVGNDHIYGGEGNDRLYGGEGSDFLDGGAGFDRIYGGDGDDKILFDHLDKIDGDSVYGHTGGHDTLILRPNVNIDFATLPNNALKNMESIDMNNGEANSITNLSVKDLLDMTDSRNTLYVNGDSGDSVQLSGAEGTWGSAEAEHQTIDGVEYIVYHGTYDTGTGTETATLYVENGLNII